MDEFEKALEEALMNELSDCSTDDAKVVARWAREWLLGGYDKTAHQNCIDKLNRANERIVEFEDIKKGHLEYVEKLQAENARRREALEIDEHSIKSTIINAGYVNGFSALERMRYEQGFRKALFHIKQSLQSDKIKAVHKTITDMDGVATRNSEDV